MGVLLLKRTNRILPVYAADISGICSALYELGGMTVMHDASGCNSTYTTHDEPRWYSMDSMVYISALSELEAVMGDDEKLVRDIVDAALNLCPAFICMGGTPIPMMMGTVRYCHQWNAFLCPWGRGGSEVDCETVLPARD